jgi:hypothetical protein
MEPMTPEQVTRYITAARDSVTVINEQLSLLAAGRTPSRNIKGNIERNVGHLEIVVAKQEVIDSEHDISDLHTAITAGKAKLEEGIWGNIEENKFPF